MKQKIVRWCVVLGLGVMLPMLILNFFSKKEIPANKKALDIGVDRTVVKVLVDNEVRFMNMEDYVLGVVLAEMPASFEVEALKAQAVIARTYCSKRMMMYDKHEQGAVCTQSSCCQGFCDPDHYQGTQHELEKAKQAVAATEGQVLTYDGELIDATYFSCSGGKTESAVEVWGKEVPYLQSVVSYGEQDTTHYLSTVTYSISTCAEKLAVDSEGFCVENITYTEGGGVDKIWIGNHVFSGVQVRELLGLKSTAFHMQVINDDVIITVRGYGHRVGMSQYGANAMALAGSPYADILSYYYQGTSVEVLVN